MNWLLKYLELCILIAIKKEIISILIGFPKDFQPRYSYLRRFEPYVSHGGIRI